MQRLRHLPHKKKRPVAVGAEVDHPVEIAKKPAADISPLWYDFITYAKAEGKTEHQFKRNMYKAAKAKANKLDLSVELADQHCKATYAEARLRFNGWFPDA